MPASPLRTRSSNKAAALIIVLAFVVLLTGVTLAYFSRTTSDRQLAHSSYNDIDADFSARTAVDVIVSDLRQEIVDGSTATTFADGSTGYTPSLPAYMVPQRSGSSSLVPNLIRRSMALTTRICPPGRPSRASAVSSIPDPANPKRGDVTKARWNEHYLVPKLTTGDDSTDPIAAFAWHRTGYLLPARALTVITAPDTPVVGRYAYAVYDEGGLLDMNVAGYPTCGATGYPPAGSSWVQPGRKGSLAFADLTGTGKH